MFNRKAFGKRISDAREQVGIKSAESLAKMIEKQDPDRPVTRSTISKWEAGVQTKGLEVLAGICDTLNVSADWLLFQIESTQLDIYRETGLNASSIAALRQLKAIDPDGRVMAAVNKALSDSDFLNNLATFMQIESTERGHHFGSCSPENGFYQVEMSPDTYAQTVLLTMNQQLEWLRTGDRPKEYPPQVRRNEQTTEELQQAEKLIERGEK